MQFSETWSLLINPEPPEEMLIALLSRGDHVVYVAVQARIGCARLRVGT